MLSVAPTPWTWLPLIILAVEWSLRIALVLRILSRRSPNPDATAWVVFIALVPVLGLAVYLLVGETPLGRRRLRAHDRLEQRVAHATAQVLQVAETGATCPTDTVSASMLRLCRQVSGSPVVGGNDLELMDDAALVLDRLAADIDRAEQTCHLMYYIWGLSPRAVEVNRALMRAARRGVACRVIADAVGSRPFLNSDWPGLMGDAGVRVCAALPVNPLRRSLHRIDLRNHRKLAVIDGRVAYCGSQNLIDERVRVRPVPPKYMTWIDTTVRVRGPAVLPLQAAFLGDWLYDGDEPDLNIEPLLRVPEPAGASLVQTLPSGPGERADAIHQAFLGMLNTADREVIITTPYFVPDEATKAALLNAALRGVSVTLIVPEELDSPLVAAAGRAHFEDLLNAGVGIALHQGGLLHAKTAVIDHRLAMIGSANFDRRSFWLNFELTLLVFDPVFTKTLRDLQQRYLGASRSVRAEDWRRRGRTQRLVDNSADLLSPLL
jgi:cardiolipin synthase